MVRTTIRFSDRVIQIIEFHSRRLNILADNNSERIRKVLDSLHSHFLSNEEQLERTAQILVELHKCPKVPTLITKGTHSGMIYCPSPKTVGLRKGNYVELEICQNCWIRQETDREREGIPTAKQELAPSYTTETQKVSKKKRTCIDCGKDITDLADWKTRCLFCISTQHILIRKKSRTLCNL